MVSVWVRLPGWHNLKMRTNLSGEMVVARKYAPTGAKVAAPGDRRVEHTSDGHGKCLARQ